MKISAEGRAFVEAFEGCRLRAYHDEVGVLTIGYGHTNLGNIAPHISNGDVWSVAQCDQALANDMASFERDVLHIMAGVDLTQGEFDALVSFDFNTGSLAKSSIPRKIRAGNKAAAMGTLLQYNHAGGSALPGLTRRRKAERLLFEGQTTAAVRLSGAHMSKPDPMPKASLPAGVSPHD